MVNPDWLTFADNFPCTASHQNATASGLADQLPGSGAYIRPDFKFLDMHFRLPGFTVAHNRRCIRCSTFPKIGGWLLQYWPETSVGYCVYYNSWPPWLPRGRFCHCPLQWKASVLAILLSQPYYIKPKLLLIYDIGNLIIWPHFQMRTQDNSSMSSDLNDLYNITACLNGIYISRFPLCSIYHLLLIHSIEHLMMSLSLNGKLGKQCSCCR